MSTGEDVIMCLLHMHMDYLPYIDRIMVGFCSKSFNKYIKSYSLFIDIVKKELSKYLNPDQLDTFINLIIKHKIVISGSFILACIMGETWYNDIDIYENYDATQKSLISADKAENIKTFIVEHDHILRARDGWYFDITNDNIVGYIKNSSYTPMSKFLYENTNTMAEDDFFTPSMGGDKDQFDEKGFAHNIRMFEIRGMIFQHIPLTCNPDHIIAKTFDTNILKNTFDGTTLKVWSWDLLHKRKSKMKPTGVLIHYYCDFHVSLQDKHFQEVLDKTKERIEKYCRRGFDFELHEKYQEICNYLVTRLPCNTKTTFNTFNDLIMSGDLDFSQWD